MNNASNYCCRADYLPLASVNCSSVHSEALVMNTLTGFCTSTANDPFSHKYKTFMGSITQYAYYKTGNYNLGERLPVCLFQTRANMFQELQGLRCSNSSLGMQHKSSHGNYMAAATTLSLLPPLQITETQSSISFTNHTITIEVVECVLGALLFCFVLMVGVN